MVMLGIFIYVGMMYEKKRPWDLQSFLQSFAFLHDAFKPPGFFDDTEPAEENITTGSKCQTKGGREIGIRVQSHGVVKSYRLGVFTDRFSSTLFVGKNPLFVKKTSGCRFK